MKYRAGATIINGAGETPLHIAARYITILLIPAMSPNALVITARYFTILLSHNSRVPYYTTQNNQLLTILLLTAMLPTILLIPAMFPNILLIPAMSPNALVITARYFTILLSHNSRVPYYTTQNNQLLTILLLTAMPPTILLILFREANRFSCAMFSGNCEP